MEFASWRSYWRFAHVTRNSFRYIHDEETHKFLEALVYTSKTRVIELPPSYPLWRAQIGCSEKPIFVEGEHIDDEEIPYPPERMKPLPGQASDGRANSRGIPILYLASDRKTALSEVRPWVGLKCSVGHFKISKSLTLVDFSKDKPTYPLYLVEPNPEEREKVVWGQINQAFSRPVTRHELHADYVPTQIIAELFKKNEFDGIVYKSNLGSGHNIALFSSDDAKLISCHLYEIKTVEIIEDEITNPYWTP